jgi:KaiC/GvpD/RAD55 family RecA-like ATPase
MNAEGLLESVLERLQAVQREGNRYKALCPAHPDSTPSLTVRLGERGILLRCFAGCDHKAVLLALGMRAEELFYDYEPHRPSESLPAPPVFDPSHTLGLTRQAFAEHKQLPDAFLAAYGVRDDKRAEKNVVLFPYPTRDGSPARTRIRACLTGKARFRWEPGESVIAAYDPDLGKLAKARRSLVIVEGESDTLTLLFAGFPAIGLPGAQMARCLLPEHLAGIDRVYVLREPDRGGDAIARDVPAALRKIDYHGKLVVIPMPGDAKDASALYLKEPGRFAHALQELFNLHDPPQAQSFEQLLATLGKRRAVLKTEFGALDRAADDGGIPIGSLCVLVGGPGAKKTGMAVHLADVLSRQGAAVMMLCADESRHNAVLRLAQRDGFRKNGLRDEGDAGDAVRSEAVRKEKARKRTLLLVDPGAPQNAQTIEAAHAALVVEARARTCVLIVDSLQTCRSELADLMSDPRAIMDAKMKALRACARTDTIVIVVSETRRGFYNGDRKEPVSKEEVLSSGKESGGIEYGADLVMGIVRDKRDDDLVEVVVAKSRFGQEPRFRLRWDRDHATLTELSRDDADAVATVSETRTLDNPKTTQRREALRQQVLRHLLRHPGEARPDVRAALGKGRTPVYEAIDELLASGQLREEQQPTGKGHRSALFAAAVAPCAEDNGACATRNQTSQDEPS